MPDPQQQPTTTLGAQTEAPPGNGQESTTHDHTRPVEAPPMRRPRHEFPLHGETAHRSPLLDKLLTHGSPQPDEAMIVIGGYLEEVPTGEPGHWLRLYRSLDLRDYIEFSSAEVLHFKQLDSATKELGVTVIWLKATAQVRRTRPQPAALQSDFFEGEILDHFMPSGDMQGLRALLRGQMMNVGSPGCGSPAGIGSICLSRMGAGSPGCGSPAGIGSICL